MPRRKVKRTFRGVLVATVTAVVAAGVSMIYLVGSGFTGPVVTAPPTITGSVSVGQPVTCDVGSWDHLPYSYSISWESSPNDSPPWTSIGAGSPYTIASTDEGKRLRCHVVAANPAGSGTADSTSIGPTPDTNPLLIVSDTFTGADSADLGAHIGEVGADWTKHPAVARDAFITSNRIRGDGDIGRSRYYASGIPSSADYDVEAVFYWSSTVTSEITGIFGRLDTSADTGYQIRWAPSGWGLFRINAGIATQLGSTYVDLPSNGATRTVKLEMRGTAIKAYIDGVERIAATDASITAAGRVGVGLRVSTATSGVHIDSVTATLATPPPPPALQCADGLDNDSDGLTDFPADPGCASAADDSEVNAAPAVCNNGLDDDSDGLTDFPADPGCANAADQDEYNDPPPPPPPPPQSGLANIWIYPTGSDTGAACAEHVAPVAAPGDGCATANKARQLASSGDIVRFKCGSYTSLPTSTLDVANDATRDAYASPVVFSTEDDTKACATFGTGAWTVTGSKLEFHHINMSLASCVDNGGSVTTTLQPNTTTLSAPLTDTTGTSVTLTTGIGAPLTTAGPEDSSDSTSRHFIIKIDNEMMYVRAGGSTVGFPWTVVRGAKETGFSTAATHAAGATVTYYKYSYTEPACPSVNLAAVTANSATRAHDVLLDDIKASRFYITSAYNSTIKNSDFGPSRDLHGLIHCSGSVSPCVNLPHDILIDNVANHDYYNTTDCISFIPGCEAPRHEGTSPTLNNGYNITVNRWKSYNCSSLAWLISPFLSDVHDVTVTNSYIGAGCGSGMQLQNNQARVVTSGSHTLPVATITVATAPSSFTMPGDVYVGGQTVSCTGKTTTAPFTFTGCTGGTGTIATGTSVGQGYGYYNMHFRNNNFVAFTLLPTTSANECIDPYGAARGGCEMRGNVNPPLSSNNTAYCSGNSGYGYGWTVEGNASTFAMCGSGTLLGSASGSASPCGAGATCQNNYKTSDYGLDPDGYHLTFSSLLQHILPTSPAWLPVDDVDGQTRSANSSPGADDGTTVVGGGASTATCASPNPCTVNNTAIATNVALGSISDDNGGFETRVIHSIFRPNGLTPSATNKPPAIIQLDCTPDDLPRFISLTAAHKFVVVRFGCASTSGGLWDKKWGGGRPNGTPATGRNDEPAIRALISYITTCPGQCIDPENVWLEGESTAGAMVMDAACDPITSPLIRGIIEISSGLGNSASGPNCPSTNQNLFILVIAGELGFDQTLWGATPTSINGTGLAFTPYGIVDYWRTKLGCTAPETSTTYLTIHRQADAPGPCVFATSGSSAARGLGIKDGAHAVICHDSDAAAPPNLCSGVTRATNGNWDALDAITFMEQASWNG